MGKGEAGKGFRLVDVGSVFKRCIWQRYPSRALYLIPVPLCQQSHDLFVPDL